MSSANNAYQLAFARLRRELFLGRGAHTGRLHFLNPEHYGTTAAYIIGSPGFGKSRMMLHLLMAHTRLNTPASIIENQGEIAPAYLQFLLRQPRLIRDRRIIAFKPGAAGCPGFNPFASSLAAGDIASLVLEAFMRVFGQDSFNQTLRLEGVLRNTFHVLAANRAPLARAFDFLQPSNRALRESLLANVAHPRTRTDCMEMERWPLSIKQERLESSLSRVRRVVQETGAIERLFEREENAVDFNRILDRGEFLVADLSAIGSTQGEALVGAMLANGLYHAAKHRPQHKRALRVIAFDEFPQYVTSDLARSLDQFRKFSVHLMLAHQRFAQLDDNLRSAVNACAKIKVVFGGNLYEDAELLAHELFPNEVRGDRVKYRNFQTKFRPILTQREVESFSDSEADSMGDSSGSSDSSSWSNGDSTARALFGTDETLTHAQNSSHGASSGSTSSYSSSHSSAQGHTVSYPWVTDHEEFQEESTPTFWSLDEQWHALTARIMSLEKREALIKVFNNPVLDITTPEVKHLPSRLLRRKRKKLPKAGADQAAPIEGTVLPPARPDDDLPEDFHE